MKQTLIQALKQLTHEEVDVVRQLIEPATLEGREATERERVALIARWQEAEGEFSKGQEERQKRAAEAQAKYEAAYIKMVQPAKVLEGVQAETNQARFDHANLQRSIQQQLRKTAPSVIPTFIAACRDELERLRHPSMVETERRFTGKKNYADQKMYEVHSNQPSIRRRIVALTRCVHAEELLMLTCATEADALQQIAQMKNELPALVLEHIGNEAA